jgi:hypothetical protein
LSLLKVPLKPISATRRDAGKLAREVDRIAAGMRISSEEIFADAAMQREAVQK